MLKIYNSLNDELEIFTPLKDNEVTIYLCGPTVYNYIHIGNARNVVVFDVIHRHLKNSGYNVRFCSNITDIDDKIIAKAKAEGVTEKELTTFYSEAFLADCQNLHISADIKRLYATDYIEEIIEFIGALIERGAAYERNGTVFFEIDTLDTYAELSHQSIEHLLVGARIEKNEEKKSAIDFVLWKPTTEGVAWDSPWSKGRPGWHTECVAMIASEFGGAIDIHGGGMDLKFPHHDNEIAQAKALGWDRLATYWIHNGFVELNDEKMSKSLGNFILLKDALETYGATAIRYWLLSVHYRQPLMFSEAIMLDAVDIVQKMQETYKNAVTQLKLHEYLTKSFISSERVIEQQNKVQEALDQDFNTANVITILHDVMKQVNIHLRQGEKSFGVLVQYLTLVQDINELLQLEICEDVLVTAEDRETYHAWKAAKAAKDFATADTLRDRLLAKGIQVR